MRFKEFISESINDKGKLKAIFLAGIPGSGKSYTIEKIMDGKIMPRMVNTDEIFEYYGKKLGIELKGEANAKIWDDHRNDAKHLTKEKLRAYINGLLPLIIDGTSGDISNILARKGMLESLGYDCGMIYVQTSLDTALKRNDERDRSVDENYIKKLFKIAESNKDYYKTKFDFYLEINNDTGNLTDDIVMSAFKKSAKFYEEPIQNPVGKRIIDDLTSKKKSYLDDTEYGDRLKNNLEVWYRK